MCLTYKIKIFVGLNYFMNVNIYFASLLSHSVVDVFLNVIALSGLYKTDGSIPYRVTACCATRIVQPECNGTVENCRFSNRISVSRSEKIVLRGPT